MPFTAAHPEAEDVPSLRPRGDADVGESDGRPDLVWRGSPVGWSVLWWVRSRMGPPNH